MRKFLLLMLAVVAIPAFAIACGGSDSKKTIDTGDGKVTVDKKLPDDFPDDFPIYKGADYQGGVSGNQGGVQGFYGTWKTGDDFEKVRDYYADVFKDGKWKATSNGSTGSDTSFWVVENTADKKAAYVLVSKDGGDTIITGGVGDSDTNASDGGDDDTPTSGDSGDDTPTASDGGDSGGGTLPDEAKLNDDFPKDKVYIPDGARVTTSSKLSSGGSSTHIVELYVKGSDVSKLGDEYKSKMTGDGWTDAFTTEEADNVYQTYSRGDASDEVAGVTVSKASVDGYLTVTITATLKD